jgi:hypothetical protein
MKEEYVLFLHITGGGAIYLTDNHDFSLAKIVIRIDGGAELLLCEIEVEDEN